MNVAIVGEFPREALCQIKAGLEAYPDRFRVAVAGTQEEAEKLTDAECIVLRILKLTAVDLMRYPKLRFVQKWGAGFDTVDIRTAAQRGVLVSNTPGVNAFSVAEQAVMLMLCVYRNFVNHYEFTRQGIWTKGRFMERTYSLQGKLVGLIGMGRIGREVAKRVQAFGAEVCYYDPFRMKPEDEAALRTAYLPMDELLRKADVISLHVPLTEENRNMINADRLKLMKPTSILINTARGGLVDEKALCGALERGELLGAGLDCLASEPLQQDNPLLKAPNVTITPHIGGTSMDLNGLMATTILDNIMRYEATGKPNYVVNSALLAGA